jgi:hypothetical protein
MIQTLLILFLGRFLGHSLVQWWIRRQNSLSPSPPLLYIDDSIWPETNDNWHDLPTDDMHWEPAPLNEWEAVGLPEPWWDEFSLPLTTALPPKQ